MSVAYIKSEDKDVSGCDSGSPLNCQHWFRLWICITKRTLTYCVVTGYDKGTWKPSADRLTKWVRDLYPLGLISIHELPTGEMKNSQVAVLFKVIRPLKYGYKSLQTSRYAVSSEISYGLPDELQYSSHIFVPWKRVYLQIESNFYMVSGSRSPGQFSLLVRLTTKD